MILMKILLVLGIIAFLAGLISIVLYASDLADIKKIDKDEIDKEFYRRLP